ncbi:MAG: hypothetical protein KDJ73_05030 [Notoacmeibacter sp.]|nr:hypothetical protein [Notoacmeibacter sp.]MCC0032744.1 hypothetical protein [Brucellaceae bacterium]
MRPGRLPLPAALRAALPGWRLTLAGSLAWAAAMALSAWIGLAMRQWALPVHRETVIAVFFCGGLAAFVPALWLAGTLRHWFGFAASQRFASNFIALSVLTIGLTAFIHSQIFRHYFSQWHEPPGSKIWILQTVFTTAAAIYHFLVMGLTLFLPVGMPALLAASLWAARRER